MAIKKRIFKILEVAETGDSTSKIFDIFLISLIALNVLAVILESIAGLSIEYREQFRAFEFVSVIVFTVEYLLRIWTCSEIPRFSRPITGRLRFALTPLILIDFLAVLPFYLPMFIAFDLRFIRALRLIRLFRLFKMARYTDAIKTIGTVLCAKKEELFITVFTVFVLLIIASSLMFYFEKDVQPDAFSSIPAAMWWGVATLTTVGYGDVYPVTIAGKILGAIIAILGIGLFALPAGILGSGFVEEIQKKRLKENTCPHCGKNI
jgi:voltage-gated potassium channel